MRALQALMMLLGALAVLMTGALPASAGGAATSAPPCHQERSHRGAAETPSPASGKMMKAMDCCVGCVAAPQLRSPEPVRVVSPRPTKLPLPAAMPVGEQPAPEPHPPRPILL
ncbi:hypothetical protein GGQ87_002233 [Brevundimonas alba]|uniref:DUF2946 domain-containing protein n=1 Tax=Brevundimonas alba TaxID=74314 RepID=A0A7X5YLH2_9CAUL|nr:hypothetical protein [Brevundimonas alba]NJC41938.1 hypothetical protein [Brevundimonas alba]